MLSLLVISAIKIYSKEFPPIFFFDKNVTHNLKTFASCILLMMPFLRNRILSCGTYEGQVDMGKAGQNRLMHDHRQEAYRSVISTSTA